MSVVCFSLRPLFVKLVFSEMNDVVTLLALRMALALPVFVAVALWTRRGAPAPIVQSDLWKICGLGFLGYYAASMLDFLALQYIPAGVSRLLLFLYPTMVVALSAVVLKIRVLPREVVALVLSYAGMALVIWNTAGGLNHNFLSGVGYDVVSSLVFAIYLVGGAQVISRIGSMRFTAYAMIVASFFCILQFVLLRPMSALLVSPRVFFLTLAIAAVSTVLPVFMMSEALRRIGAKKVALMGGIGPLTVIALAHVGINEVMTPVQLIGAALVVAGVLAVNLRAAEVEA